MKQTYITYATAEALKAFLGESAPEPLCRRYVYCSRCGERIIYLDSVDCPHCGGPEWIPAYQLHDFLSRAFCEAMAKKLAPESVTNGFLVVHIAATIFGAYYNSGLPAVEAALMEMMGKEGV